MAHFITVWDVNRREEIVVNIEMIVRVVQSNMNEIAIYFCDQTFIVADGTISILLNQIKREQKNDAS